jgi:hypothetical protein
LGDKEPAAEPSIEGWNAHTPLNGQRTHQIMNPCVNCTQPTDDELGTLPFCLRCQQAIWDDYCDRAGLAREILRPNGRAAQNGSLLEL